MSDKIFVVTKTLYMSGDTFTFPEKAFVSFELAENYCDDKFRKGETEVDREIFDLLVEGDGG